MARWLAIMALLSLGSGCAVKMSSGQRPVYDLTEYETYDQPLNADVSAGFSDAVRIERVAVEKPARRSFSTASGRAVR